MCGCLSGLGFFCLFFSVFFLIFFPFPGLGDLLASPLCGGGTEPCHLAAEAWALRTSTVLPVYLAIYRKVILKRRRACCSGLFCHSRSTSQARFLGRILLQGSVQKSKTSYPNLLKLALWQGNHYHTFNSQTKRQRMSHTFSVRSMLSG